MKMLRSQPRLAAELLAHTLFAIGVQVLVHVIK